MSKFGFLTGKTNASEPVPAAGKPSSRIELAHLVPAGVAPGMAWSEDVVARLSSLRGRLHQQLSASSRDYTILMSLKSSKIAYCDTVTRELTQRLAANPFFEVLQHLDEAQAQIGKSAPGGGR